MANNELQKGYAYTISAYVFWGVVPAFFKLLDHIPADEIFVQRIVWSLLFTALLALALKRTQELRATLRSTRTLLLLCVSACLIAGNWILFIWAANNGHLIEISLGYYITPLMSIFLALVFLKERLSALQYLALSCAIAGVLFQLVSLGKLPLISLGLALAFGFYSFTRRFVKINSIDSLLLETVILIIPSLIYFYFFTEHRSMDLSDFKTVLLLLLCGPVTSVPLILFAAGVQRIPFSTVGFLQYLAPSISLFMAIFIYREDLSWQKTVTFMFIWLALIIYSVDSIQRVRKKQTVTA